DDGWRPLHAGRHRVYDSARVLVVRILVREDDLITVGFGYRAHFRALPGIAPAAGIAEYADAAGRIRFVERLQGVGCVRVVDNRLEVLALIDALGAARNALEERERVSDGVERHAEEMRGLYHRERVHHAEAARKLEREANAFVGECDRARSVHDIGCGCERERERALDREREEGRAPRVVCVCDDGARTLWGAGELFADFKFRLRIVLEAA